MKFFRIITAEITSRSKLKLPDKFVERHGANMPGTVSLKVPTGAKWRVEVKKKEDGLWFGKGLFEFCESLGVELGHFLIFEYDGCDVFHVVVIDLSAVEIQYPVALSSIVEDELQGVSVYASKCLNFEPVEDDADMKLHNRSKEAPAPYLKYPIKLEKDGNLGCIRSLDERVKTDLTTIKNGNTGGEIIIDGERRIQCVIQGRRLSQASLEKLISRARAFKAEEPVCIIALRPTYVQEKSSNSVPPKCQLLFPICFIKAYFYLENKNIELRINDGKTWSVEYRLEKYKKQAFFTYGWKQFVKDNSLQSNDVCLFELIKGASNALKVVIFRYMDGDQASK